MYGSATLAIEVSSTSSVAPSITASAMSHLCVARRSGAGVSEDAGTIG
jgi:hypothetical protein